MADEADLANDEAAFRLVVALKNNHPRTMPNTGFCYYCGEPTRHLFCDTECRDEHDRETDIRKRQGIS